ncbi:PACE efflux transporter [Pasteurella bettyae]|uniref:PACE efflux transporter n=1 Tax=Pasteurella bettyae TaxID=752 RepID=UPI003D2C83CE
MSFLERIFHSALFEIGAILLSIAFIWIMTGTAGSHESITMILISLIAMVWNFIFNWVFDQFFTGPKEHRSAKLRLFHATSFEGGLLIITLPIIAYCLNISLIAAFFMDLGISIMIVIYGYLFNWIYDHLRPLIISNRQ